MELKGKVYDIVYEDKDTDQIDWEKVNNTKLVIKKFLDKAADLSIKDYLKLYDNRFYVDENKNIFYCKEHDYKQEFPSIKFDFFDQTLMDVFL